MVLLKFMIMVLTLIWAVIFFAAIALYLRQKYSRFSKGGVKYLPPTPFVGNLGRVFLQKDHTADFLERLYKAFPDERFVGSYQFFKPCLLIRDTELVKQITIKHFEHFVDHPAVVDERHEPFFGRSLMRLTGQEWKDMRSTLSPAFTSSKIRMMVPFMVEAGDQMVLSLKKKVTESEVNYIDVDATEITTRYANDVIASCAFGLKVQSQMDEINQFYEMAKSASSFNFVQILKYFGFSACPDLMAKFNITLFSTEFTSYFKNLVMNTMRERETRNINRSDMIQLLMEAKKGTLSHDVKAVDEDAGFATVEESAVGKKEVNRVWSDDDLVAQAVLFLIAGFDTVSSAMSFAMYELAVNPEVQEKLVQEIKETNSKNGGKFDYKSIQEMSYMDMVISEVLRLWSPGFAFDRQCIKDFNLGKPNDTATEDYIIHKGEAVGIPSWAFHRDPQYFSDPLKFNPERFSAENRQKIKPFTYIPFGLGPRNCIGSRFALCEVKVMLYQLLQHVEISPCEKTRIPAQLAKNTFSVKMDGGHWIRLKTRS